MTSITPTFKGLSAEFNYKENKAKVVMAPEGTPLTLEDGTEVRGDQFGYRVVGEDGKAFTHLFDTPLKNQPSNINSEDGIYPYPTTGVPIAEAYYSFAIQAYNTIDHYIADEAPDNEALLRKPFENAGTQRLNLNLFNATQTEQDGVHTLTWDT